MPPETRYAKSGGVHIAYQVIGDGPIDLVYVPGFVSHIGYAWEFPPFARFLHRLAAFSRLIWFDKRGTGLSDRVEVASLEQRMDDVRAVMEASAPSAPCSSVSPRAARCVRCSPLPIRTARSG